MTEHRARAEDGPWWKFLLAPVVPHWRGLSQVRLVVIALVVIFGYAVMRSFHFTLGDDVFVFLILSAAIVKTWKEFREAGEILNRRSDDRPTTPGAPT